DGGLPPYGHSARRGGSRGAGPGTVAGARRLLHGEGGRMKITGLRALILAPRENHHQEVPEYVRSKTRQNGVAIIQTDEGIEGVVSSEASNVRRLAQLWAGAREHIEGQDPFDRGKIAWTLRRRFQWPQRQLGGLDYGLWD